MWGLKTKLAICNIAIFLGAMLTMFGVYYWLSAQEAVGWVETEGVISSNRVATEVGAWRVTSPGKRYYYQTSYNYIVDNKEHSSDQYALIEGHVTGGKYFATESEARGAALSALPVGQSVSVWYDPDDHARAVLSNAMGWKVYAPLVAGLILLLGGYAVRLEIS